MFNAYSVCMVLAFLAGIAYYFYYNRGGNNEHVMTIVTWALVCGFVGAKLPLLLEGASLITLLTGKSIIGGLAGGMLGVYTIKRIKHIRLRIGNVIAPSVALGMSIGRIGCYLNGCCAGIPASWGKDFGDGITRLPTQLFEVVFHLTAFLLLHRARGRVKTPGLLFKLYLLCYFTFRFFMEFIRINPKLYWGMSVYQVLCLAGILFMLFTIHNMRKEKCYE
ncbi:MAG: prolipoprotein diacylglyceryl transferase [Angelakisella sp.]